MGIHQITPQSQIEKYLMDKVQELEKKVIKHMCYIGEKCINTARENGTYTDQTGNLRNSIGYVVATNGRIIQSSDFKGEGGKKGRELIDEKIRELNKGYILIVVAGMKYAAYVEAMNYDVLTSSELQAEKLITQLKL